MEQLPNPPQHTASTAAQHKWNCSICYDNQEDIAYMSPCMHQFCLGCAVRWAWEKGNCPLCRSVTTKIVFSVLSDNDFLTFDIPGATEPLAENDEDEVLYVEVLDDDSLMFHDLSPTELEAGDSEEEEGAARPMPGGFPTEVWAAFFSSHPNNVRPLLPWLRHELGQIYHWQWWEVAVLETSVVVYLCLVGLDEELLVHQLQHFLQGQTRTFVQHLIATAVNRCRDKILHQGQQDPHATDGDDDSPAASTSSTASQEGTPSSSWTSSSSPASSGEEKEGGLSEAAGREQPQEGPGEAAASGHSASGRGKDCSPKQPRRPPKRRAPRPQYGPQPHKRLL